MKKSQSKSPTPIGWVDYLDSWAESKIANLVRLDFLDFDSKDTKFSTHS